MQSLYAVHEGLEGLLEVVVAQDAVFIKIHSPHHVVVVVSELIRWRHSPALIKANNGG